MMGQSNDSELSARLSYDKTKRFTVYVQDSNLLGEAIQRYGDYRTVPASYNYRRIVYRRIVFFRVRARL